MRRGKENKQRQVINSGKFPLLELLLEERGISWYQLAKECGINVSNLYAARAGRSGRDMWQGYKERICKHLKVEEREIFSFPVESAPRDGIRVCPRCGVPNSVRGWEEAKERHVERGAYVYNYVCTACGNREDNLNE